MLTKSAFSTLALILCGVCAVPLRVGAACSGITVSPGDTIQTKIDANPAGTTFCVQSGTYTITTSLVPKANDKFIAVTPRTAIFTSNDTVEMFINFKDNPATTGVEIRGLVIVHFLGRNAGGYGAIKGGDYWIYDNNEFGWIDQGALYGGNHVKITNNYFHHARSTGGGAFKGTDILYEGNEIAYMNPNGYSDSVTKWTGTNGLVVRNNHSHDNNGSGLWVDGDNINFIIENNRVENNTLQGIHYEISCAGIVRNNIILNNGGAGIQIVDSQNPDVYGNFIKGNKQGGIFVWHQNRGAAQTGTENCPWTDKNIQIHNNTIQQDVGFTGVRLYQNTDGNAIYGINDGRVKFFANTYYNNIPSPFYWMSNIQTKAVWQGSYGQDLDSTFLTGNAPAPGATPCDVNGDNLTNISDAQLSVNTAIGKTSCIPTYDITKDGVCNVVDVQRVVNAALGGQCASP